MEPRPFLGVWEFPFPVPAIAERWMQASHGAGFVPEAAELTEMPWAVAADGMPALLRCTDPLGHCGFVNQAWRDFTGLAPHQAHGQGWEATLHPEDLAGCRATLAEALAAARPFRLEYRLRRADGAWRWVVEEGRPLFRHGQVMHLLAQCLDVTDMREALVDRHRMAAEREALVQELQHRVRNNAQATSSVLSLQAGRSRDAVVAAALRGAAARVLLATQVQDRMFHMADTTTVELAPELLAAAQAACDLAGQDRARLRLLLEPGIAVPVRQAAPLALIVNELTTNALHHAFPPGSSGLVQVALRRIAPQEAELEVMDDGIGLPQDDATAAGAAPAGGMQGLGLHLVGRLARQAGSALVVQARPPDRQTGEPEGQTGTRLFLRFPAVDNTAPLAGL